MQNLVQNWSLKVCNGYLRRKKETMCDILHIELENLSIQRSYEKRWYHGKWSNPEERQA